MAHAARQRSGHPAGDPRRSAHGAELGLCRLRVQAPVLQVGKARPGGRQRCLHHKAEESLEQELLGEPRTAAFRHSAASL